MIKMQAIQDFTYEGIMARAVLAENGKMDDVRRRILTLCEDQGVSLREASQRLGKNPAYLQQYLHRGTPGTLPEKTRCELASMLGVQESLLAPADMRRDVAAIRRLDASTSPRGVRIPIAGYARGGLDVLTLNDDEPSAFVDRPAELEAVDDAFAVEVVGDSHEPRCRAGEIVLVNPRSSPSRGADVVIRYKDGHAIIAEFVALAAGRLKVVKHNAPKAIDIDAGEIEGVYPITHIIPRPNRYAVR
jgi:transcriptional regulator with XRE-family HTH domain